MSKKRIHSTKSSIEASGIERQLQEEDIAVMVIDKMDSAHGSVFGYIEIFVEDTDFEKAEQIVRTYLQD